MPTTLLDVAKLNGNDAVVGLIEASLKFSPEAQIFPFRTIRGTSYKTVQRTGLPTVSFRSANEGVTPSKSEFSDKTVECFILDSQIEVDKAIADAYEDGAAAFQAIEATGVMQAAMRKLGSQVWYGTVNDAKGFPGLKAFTAKGATTLNGDAMTVDATGDTATTASSVYLVSFGNQNLQMVGGQNSTFQLEDFRIQTITKSAKNLTAYVAGLTAWVGMQIGHENVVRRILNLTAQSGKGLTDLLLADAMATFPVGYQPDAIFMSRRSRAQLQKARTVTLFGQGTTRANQPLIAPVPTEYEGIPIIVTDSILNTDAIE
jgi:hypothetical protein